MKFELKLNKISLDTAAVRRDMKPYIKQALDDAEEWLIELMWDAIDETSSAPHEWRDALKSDLHRVSEEALKDHIKYSVGVDYPEGTGAWMRAMVIAYGMGIYGLNGERIYAGPYGRIVWDNDLENMVPSQVENEHEIPMTWYHAGGWFIHNAISNLRTIYDDVIESAMANMPDAVFSKNVKVKSK